MIFTGKICLSQDLIAGGIELENISNLTYKVKVYLCTKTSANIDRQEIMLNWGDATSNTLPGTEYVSWNNISIYEYTDIHTYPGNGSYIISFIDSFRTDSINNILNSDSAIFFIQYTTIIDSSSVMLCMN